MGVRAEDLDRAKALYAAGAGIPALAAAFGSDTAEVRHLLTRAGVTLRPPECDAARAAGKPIPPGVRRRMLREGWTPAELDALERSPLEVTRRPRPYGGRPSRLGPFPDAAAAVLGPMRHLNAIDPTATAVALAQDLEAVAALAAAFPPKAGLFTTTTTTTTNTTTNAHYLATQAAELAAWLPWSRIVERLGGPGNPTRSIVMAASSWGNQRVRHPFAATPKRAIRAWRQEVMAAQRRAGLRVVDIAARWSVSTDTVHRQLKRHRSLTQSMGKRAGFSKWGLDKCEELEQSIPRNLIQRSWT
ncbi:MAG: hypothetical protein D6683_09515 [Actinomyces sp.]|nr:MAG: hypothetical protein D6683_09515 [Actinomyces sp.]